MRKKVSKKLIDKINFKYKNMIHLNLSNVEWKFAEKRPRQTENQSEAELVEKI